MPERTAVVRRVVEVVEGRGDVAVVGPPCPWRDDLVDVLAERLPGAAVRAHDAVPDGVSATVATVGLEISEQEAAFQARRAGWETSDRKARGEPLVQGGHWVATRPLEDSDEGVPPAAPVPDVDVVFVPVSGVRPPRRLHLFWDWSDHVLWDEENAHLGELEDLLPISPALRQRLRQWVATVDASIDRATSEVGVEDLDGPQRCLAAALAEELGPEFVVET